MPRNRRPPPGPPPPPLPPREQVVAFGPVPIPPAWQTEIRDLMSPGNSLLRGLEASLTASETALRERMTQAMFSAPHITIDPSAFQAFSGLADQMRGIGTATIITDEVNMPAPTTPDFPSEGAEVMPEPTHYLGMRVVRTGNVRPNAVILQAAPGGGNVIHVHPTTAPDVWQAETRRQLARLIQRSAPVSIKQNCRYCGKAFPARQGTALSPDPYCSARCQEAARDLIDCPTCAGTGGTTEHKCGECYGSTYMPCNACQEDHARISLMFTSPSTGSVYYVCPSCVADEREAGGVQAPQASV